MKKSINPPRVWWWAKEDNFGDWIGPWLVNRITGVMPARPVHASPQQSSVYSVGSIIAQVMPGGLVWGSGIIKSDCRPKGKVDIRSVRGPLTRRRLEQLRMNCPERYGDPGMLMPKYAPSQGPKKYKLGIIPHYVDYKEIMALPIAKDPRVLVINLRTRDVDSVLRQLSQCERTVSSSLHGVVISVAYGIPTRWVVLGNKLFGNQVKFFDFFLSLEPKESHKTLMPQALDIVRRQESTKKWDASKYPALQKYLPLDYRGRMRALEYDELVVGTIKYDVTPSLLQDIEQTCPF